MGSFYLFGLPVWEDAAAANNRRDDHEDRKEINNDKTQIKQTGKTDRNADQQKRKAAQTEDRTAPDASHSTDFLDGLSIATPWGSLGFGGGEDGSGSSTGLLVVGALAVGGVVFLATRKK